MNENDTCFLCVVLNEKDMELVCSKVKGELADLTQENFGTCEQEVKKIYKIKEEERNFQINHLRLCHFVNSYLRVIKLI